MDNKFLEDMKKAFLVEQQIREEREAETEFVDNMSDEERLEYLKQREILAEEFAKNIGMKQKEITSKGKKGV